MREKVGGKGKGREDIGFGTKKQVRKKTLLGFERGGGGGSEGFTLRDWLSFPERRGRGGKETFFLESTHARKTLHTLTDM